VMTRKLELGLMGKPICFLQGYNQHAYLEVSKRSIIFFLSFLCSAGMDRTRISCLEFDYVKYNVPIL
jgi:hypothetical protein